MKKGLNEIIKTGFILFCITAAAAFFLAVVNKATAPVIERNSQKRTEQAMQAVMPSAKEFNYIASNNDKIPEAYEAISENGEKIGDCVISTANGYGGEIRVLVGIDSDNIVTGIQIMSHSETPGLGANAAKPDFYEQYTGKKAGINAVKSTTHGENDINAMSGATITSDAVTLAVNNAIDFAAELKK